MDQKLRGKFLRVTLNKIEDQNSNLSEMLAIMLFFLENKQKEQFFSIQNVTFLISGTVKLQFWFKNFPPWQDSFLIFLKNYVTFRGLQLSRQHYEECECAVSQIPQTKTPKFLELHMQSNSVPTNTNLTISGSKSHLKKSSIFHQYMMKLLSGNVILSAFTITRPDISFSTPWKSSLWD